MEAKNFIVGGEHCPYCGGHHCTKLAQPLGGDDTYWCGYCHSTFNERTPKAREQRAMALSGTVTGKSGAKFLLG